MLYLVTLANFLPRSAEVSAEVLSTGNQIKWFEIFHFSLGLNIVGNIWDNVSTQTKCF